MWWVSFILAATATDLLITAMRSDKQFRKPKTDLDITLSRVFGVVYAIGLLAALAIVLQS